MRLNIRTKFVAAKKRVTSEKCIAFTFEVQMLGEPRDFVAVFFHPARKMRRFPRALLVPEITRNEFPTDREPCVGRENHVGSFGCAATKSILQSSFESVACNPFHCSCASAASAPRARLIHGLISYSMP